MFAQRMRRVFARPINFRLHTRKFAEWQTFTPKQPTFVQLSVAVGSCAFASGWWGISSNPKTNAFLMVSGASVGCGIAVAHPRVIAAVLKRLERKHVSDPNGMRNAIISGTTPFLCGLMWWFVQMKIPDTRLDIPYTEREIAKKLKKYQPQEFRPKMIDKLLPARERRLEMLKACVCEAFEDSQEFPVVAGPHGVGKSMLAQHLAAQLSKKGNDDLKNLGVIYWKCAQEEAFNTQGILNQFDDSLGETAVADMGKNISYGQLFRVLRAYLPTDQNILMILDGVKKNMKELEEFQGQVRDVSELQDGSARIKVMVIASDSYDFAKKEKESHFENRRRLISILGFTLEEMTEWIEDFLETRDVKLVHVPQETSAAESVDPQATIPQDDEVKTEAGADGEKKEIKDTEKLALLILEHEWNMNEVARTLRKCVKPDPDDKKKKIVEYADVEKKLEHVLHVTYKWQDLEDKEMRSMLLRILGEVNPQEDDDGRIFYLQELFEDGGLSVKQIKMLCKVDLAVQVRAEGGTQIFIHPQLYYFARNQPHRFDTPNAS